MIVVLIADYSNTTLTWVTLHYSLMFVSFILVMVGFKHVLNYYHFEGADKLIKSYIWSNALFGLFSGALYLLYTFDFVSGLMALMVGIIVLVVFYFLVTILSILIGSALKQCENSLFGLLNPIRYSFMWYGILSLTFVFSELSIIASWLNTLLLLVLFIKFKNSTGLEQPVKEFDSKSGSETDTNRISGLKIAGLLFLSVILAVANYGSIYWIVINDDIVSGWSGDKSESGEGSYGEEDDDGIPSGIKPVHESNINLTNRLTRLTGQVHLGYFSGDALWVVNDTHIMVSKDKGENFVSVLNPLMDVGLGSIQFDDSQTRGVIAAESQYLAFTDDGGKTWAKSDIDALLSDSKYEHDNLIKHLQFDSEFKNGLMQYGCDLWRSEDGGKSWGRLTTMRDHMHSCITKYSGRPNESRLLVADKTYSLISRATRYWQSDNGGEDWTRVCEEQPRKAQKNEAFVDCASLGESYTPFQKEDQVYSFEELQAFHENIDRGISEPIDLTKVPDNNEFFAIDKSNNRLWKLINGLGYSNDQGVSWNEVYSGLDSDAEIVWANDAGEAIASRDCSLVYSNSFGKKWQREYRLEADNCNRLNFLFSDLEKVVFYSKNGLYSFNIDNKQFLTLISLNGQDEFLNFASSTNSRELVGLTAKGKVYYAEDEDYGFHIENFPDRRLAWVYCADSCFILEDYNSYKLALNDSTIELTLLASLPIEGEAGRESNVNNMGVDSVLTSRDSQFHWLLDDGNQLYLSRDFGSTWSKSDKLDADLTEIWYDDINGKLWSLDDEQRLWVSIDEGRNFSPSGLGYLGEFSKICSNYHWITVLGGSQARMSFDRGSTWFYSFSAGNTCLFTEQYLWLNEQTYRLDSNHKTN